MTALHWMGDYGAWVRRRSDQAQERNGPDESDAVVPDQQSSFTTIQANETGADVARANAPRQARDLYLLEKVGSKATGVEAWAWTAPEPDRPAGSRRCSVSCFSARLAAASRPSPGRSPNEPASLTSNETCSGHWGPRSTGRLSAT